MKFLRTYEGYDDQGGKLLFKYGHYTDPDEIQKIGIGDKLLCVYSSYDAFTFGNLYPVKDMTKTKSTFNVHDNDDHKRFFTYDKQDRVLKRTNHDTNGEDQLTILTTDKSIEDYVERMEMDRAVKKYNL